MRPVHRSWLVVLAIVAGALSLVAPAAWAQGLRRPVDPQDLQVPRRAPLTLTPTLAVEEEYDDNIFLDNNNKQWDFITRFTPGLALEIEQPTYRLAASYNFSAEIFARNPGLNHAFDRHNFLLDALYRVTPQLTVTLGDTFGFSTNTNMLSAEGVATGRSRGYGNSLSGGASWRFDPLMTLHGGASWSILRFNRSDLRDSDVYRADIGLDRTLTPRLTGTIGYEFGFFDIERAENLTTHTPRLGLSYRVTETLTASVNGGPAFEVTDSDTRVTPVVSASLSQRLKWGSVTGSFTRSIGTAGGLGGPAINQSVGVFAQITTLMKGLTVDFGPRYTMVESIDDRIERIDVKSFALPLSVTYRLTSWVAVIAAYQFFHQRSNSRITDPAVGSLANDVDQNRISIGLLLGYPIRFD